LGKGSATRFLENLDWCWSPIVPSSFMGYSGNGVGKKSGE